MEDNLRSQEQPAIKIYERKEFVPIVVFGVILLVLLLSTALSGHPPSVASMMQDHNLTYEVITLEGQNFGEPDDGGEVRIGDLILAPSNFGKWSDTKIVVNLPREVPSGVISVITKNGKCGGGIYINPEEMPRLASYVDPLIREVVPNKVTVGTVIRILGERFGNMKKNGRVFFTWIEESGKETDAQKISDPVMYTREQDLDYLFWSDTEIQIRVPDGAQTGKVAVVTDGGMSNFKYIDLEYPAGNKQYYNRNKYPLRLSFTVYKNNATDTVAANVWVPFPGQWPEMRRIEKYKADVPSNDSLIQGAALFEFNNTNLNGTRQITVEVIFDLYAIKSNVEVNSVKLFENTDSEFYRKFTADDYWVRPADPYLQSLYYKYFEREKNPYLYAKMIYRKLRDDFSAEETNANSFEELREYMVRKTGNAKVYAIVYCSLLRAAGIPSRIVGGYIINRGQSLSPHYWTEFFIEDLGWIPVDPYLGDEQENAAFLKEEDYQKFYFGNLDNRHIPFAKGTTEIPKLMENSRTATQNDIPVFFSHMIETAADADGIRIDWHTPKLVGIY